jgi:CrcB protein
MSRHGIGLLCARWFGKGFPVGTLVVNVVGSFLLGLLLAEANRWDVSDETRLVLGTGLCGALTTFSTFSVDALRLAERDQWALAGGYVVANLLLGFTAAGLGLYFGRV